MKPYSLKWYLFVLLILIILVGCSSPTATTIPTATIPAATATSPLATVEARTTSTPDSQIAARAYLDAWRSENYAVMYGMLTSVSREAISVEDFTLRYTEVANEAALVKPTEDGSLVDYEIRSALTNPYTAQVAYHVVLHSLLVGDVARDTVMNLSLEAGQWKVQWDDSLILPDLAGGNRLSMDYNVPSRANIYDRNGSALVAQSDAVAIGINTLALDESYDTSLLNLIAQMTNNRLRPETLGPRLENYRSQGWYLPITDVSADHFAQYESRLAAFGEAVYIQPFRTRYYFDSGANSVAPHIIGYMSAIQEGEVEYYQRLGYRWNERVGRAGLELWAEPYLAGKRGGSLYVVSPDGSIVTRLAETHAEPAQAVYTTLDKDLQLAAQNALGSFAGAIVVLERDTGRVLASASSPGFDPNLFEPTNFNYQYQIEGLYNESLPLLNRATLGTYPLGSVFKLVTIAAALESGDYTTESTYNCGYFFEEMTGFTPNDWTYDHYLEDGETAPSGLLTLPEGLMRSCNPWFWHIGLDFYTRGLTTAIGDMARGFGLGSRTGIELDPSEESPGNIPDPTSQIDAVNLAIGQGDTQVTPLQVARFVAALGNGGNLYQPHVIEQIVPPIGDPTYVFTPTLQGTIPITDTNLQIIHDAMVSVVENPRGTARHRFLNLGINVAGKTGTAESGGIDPHAWFAGYTFDNNPDLPDIAIVVFVENRGEGSDYAAPIFRRIVEAYFYGKPLTLYWWESQIGVERTPTPEFSETPEEEETATPEPDGSGGEGGNGDG